MATEIVEDSTLEHTDVFLVRIIAIIMVHIRLDVHYVAEPAFSHGPVAEPHAGVRPEHVAHLHRQVLSAAHLHNFAVRTHRLAARLVAVHGNAALRVDTGDVHKIVVGDFDEYDINVPYGQRLRLADNLQSVERQGICAVGRRRPRAVIRYSDDLEVVLHFGERQQLACRMLMLETVEQCAQRSFHLPT